MNDQQTIGDKKEWETVGYVRLSESGLSVVLTDGHSNRIGVINIEYLNQVLTRESEYAMIRMPKGE